MQTLWEMDGRITSRVTKFTKVEKAREINQVKWEWSGVEWRARTVLYFRGGFSQEFEVYIHQLTQPWSAKVCMKMEIDSRKRE